MKFLSEQLNPNHPIWDVSPLGPWLDRSLHPRISISKDNRNDSLPDIWFEFAQRRKCTLDPIYYQQIYDDLAIFKNKSNSTHPYPITDELLEFGQKYFRKFWVFTFLKNNFTMEKGPKDLWTQRWEDFLLEIAPHLPYGLKILVNDDAAPALHVRHRRLFPVFSPCKQSHYADILMPSFVHYYPRCVRDSLIPWEFKNFSNTLFWRGATTGATMGPNMEFKTTLRFRMVEWAMQITAHQASYPFIADIAFTWLRQCGDQNLQHCQELVKDYNFTHDIDCLENENYRHLLIVDGNTWVQRFVQFLRFESLLFYNPHFTEWYTNYIVKPRNLYIPVRDDFSDIPAKMVFAMEHTELIRQKVKRTSSWVRQYLRLEDFECYTFRLFLEYAKLVEIKTPTFES